MVWIQKDRRAISNNKTNKKAISDTSEKLSEIFYNSYRQLGAPRKNGLCLISALFDERSRKSGQHLATLHLSTCSIVGDFNAIAAGLQEEAELLNKFLVHQLSPGQKSIM
jgi:hypothetical protein